MVGISINNYVKYLWLDLQGSLSINLKYYIIS